MKKPRFLGILFLFSILFIVTPTNAATWTNISGRVLTQTGTPLCAMVLANGEHMFSCGGSGDYSLRVPLDSSDLITIQVFASGFAPFKESLTERRASGYSVFMDRDTSGRSFTITHSQSSLRTGWAVVTGNINYNGTPLCAMILINGQSMFSCNQNLGRYSLDVPLDSAGNITLQAFVGGFQPHRETFAGPSKKPFNQVQTERLIGTWDFNYTIGSTLFDDMYKLPAPAIESTSSPGVYFLFGSDEYGNSDVAAGYFPDSAQFALLDLSILFDKFYTFNFTGTGRIAGCYYQVYSSTDISRCYPLDGYRISTSTALNLSTQILSMGDEGLHTRLSQGEKEMLEYEEAQVFYGSTTNADIQAPVGLINKYEELKNSAEQLR